MGSGIFKKALFFQVFIGTSLDAESVCLDRLSYLECQLSYMYHFIKFHDVDASFYLVPTVPDYLSGFVEEVASKYGFLIYGGETFLENKFEYPGFRAMKDFSCQSSEDVLVLYGHSKGIFNRRPLQMSTFRLHMKLLLTSPVDEIFKDRRIQKACLFPSRYGWAWHNFFWVRSSYLEKKVVLESKNRHYFESLIGERRNFNGYKKCFGMAGYIPGLDAGSVKAFYGGKELNKDVSISKVLRAS